MAMLLALVTFGVSAYYVRQMPYGIIYLILIPANLGATGSLIFWVKAPARKKARWRAALASLFVVPCIASTGMLSVMFSPIPMWQVFGALSFMALILAIWALVRVKRKGNHPWADYYKQVSAD